MRCPGCQHENPAGSNFCLGRGARFALTCATCSAELPAGAHFCNKCMRFWLTLAETEPSTRG